MKRILALVLLVLSVGCAVKEPYRTEAPEFLTREHFAPLVLLAGKERGIATGIAVTKNRLLTVSHACTESSAGKNEDEYVFSTGQRLFRTFRLVARGIDGPHSDWAVLDTGVPSWSPENVVVIHPPALDPEWKPAVGTKVYLIGYASRMYADKKVDVRRPVPVICSEIIDTTSADPAQEEWCALGRRGMDLSGMSGGGVFVWNEELERLELIGVFSKSTTFTWSFRVLWLFDVPFKTEYWFGFERLPLDALKLPSTLHEARQ